MPKKNFRPTKATFVLSALILILSLNIYFALRPEFKSSLTEDFSNLFESSDAPVKKTIEQKMLGIHLVENDLEQKGWELFSEEAVGTSEDSWVFKKIKVQFYSENSLSFTVTGDVGEVDGQSKDMYIRGHVITESANGYSFLTRELKYDSERKTLYTLDAVEMNGPADSRGAGMKLTGTGFEIHIPTRKMKILKDVDANKMVDGKRFELKSHTAEFLSDELEGLFWGNVRMKYGTMKVSSTYTEFKYSKPKKTLSTILIYDKVNMVDENKLAVCDELVMDLIKDEMILKGNPSVKMGEDSIKGSTIVFYDKGRQMKIIDMNMQRETRSGAPL